jgi:hypothetical protein
VACASAKERVFDPGEPAVSLVLELVRQSPATVAPVTAGSRKSGPMARGQRSTLCASTNAWGGSSHSRIRIRVGVGSRFAQTRRTQRQLLTFSPAQQRRCADYAEDAAFLACKRFTLYINASKRAHLFEFLTLSDADAFASARSTQHEGLQKGDSLYSQSH